MRYAQRHIELLVVACEFEGRYRCFIPCGDVEEVAEAYAHRLDIRLESVDEVCAREVEP